MSPRLLQQENLDRASHEAARIAQGCDGYA